MVIMPIQKHKVRGGDGKNGGGSKEGAGREGGETQRRCSGRLVRSVFYHLSKRL